MLTTIVYDIYKNIKIKKLLSEGVALAIWCICTYPLHWIIELRQVLPIRPLVVVLSTSHAHFSKLHCHIYDSEWLFFHILREIGVHVLCNMAQPLILNETPDLQIFKKAIEPLFQENWIIWQPCHAFRTKNDHWSVELRIVVD